MGRLADDGVCSLRSNFTTTTKNSIVSHGSSTYIRSERIGNSLYFILCALAPPIRISINIAVSSQHGQASLGEPSNWQTWPTSDKSRVNK